MLEHETEAILAALVTRTIGAGDAILFKEIVSADIPRGIKSYLQADVIRSLEAEIFSSPRFARVERDSPGVRRQARAFVASMAATYSIPRAEFLSLLENAVHFQENFLCRPQWTIEHFVFESADRVGVAELVAKLDSTVEYAYFRTLIPRILERRGLRQVGVEEFRDILGRIDDQIVRQHNARELALLAKPIFDFLLLRDTPPDVSIPLKPILVFFDDKKMKILRDYIESISRIRQKEEITLDELTTLVEDLYLEQGETEPPPPGAPAALQETGAASAEPRSPAEPAPGDGTTGPPVESAPGDGPPGETAEHLQEDGASEPRAESAPAETGPPEPPGGAEEDRLAFEPTLEIRTPATFEFVTEEPDGRDDVPLADEPPPLADLRKLIEDHERSRFVRKVFARNEERYEDTITSLNAAGTWKEAATLLNSLYVSSGLDPFDTEVVEFTDAIQRRYQDAARGGA
ncbi:MAG TPA: hypothetical protein VL221_11890 [Bacteroidota bacterium]|nr:hypothetical protein [Bacteroidota bacterium]